MLPSNTTPFPLITGDVSVLFVSVCTPLSVTYPVKDGISEVRATVPVADGSVKTPDAVLAATICVCPVVAPLIYKPLLT